MGQEGSSISFEHSMQHINYSGRRLPEQGRMRMLYSPLLLLVSISVSKQNMVSIAEQVDILMSGAEYGDPETKIAMRRDLQQRLTEAEIWSEDLIHLKRFGFCCAGR